MSESPYMNRDLSWLSFNYRVLLEAKDTSLPLYERIKFLAIYSNNLDEFFRVRVASIENLSKVKKKKRKKWKIAPSELLDQIFEEVTRQQEEFGEIFRDAILPELEKNNIHLLNGIPSDENQYSYIQEMFEREILPYVHPEVLMKDKIVHFLRDRALYLALHLTPKTARQTSETDEGEEQQNLGPPKRSVYAIVTIPTNYFPRFIELPSEEGRSTIMFLDDIVRANLDQVFPGFDVQDCFSIKLSRDADLEIGDEFEGDLVEKIRKNLTKRKVGSPARFLYDHSMPHDLLKYLRQSFKISKRELYPGGRYHNFSDFFGFPNPQKPKLEGESLAPLTYDGFEGEGSVFSMIRERDHILHFPYHSYDPVLRFLNEAALDPQVKQIKTTQYRVASDSAIVNALISAARNGKEVSVFVEIKARFDEASNLRSAKAMEEAGVKVIYSMPNLKVHAKIAMVVRSEVKGERCYAFLSTGNFNEKTAKLYGDHGLFTADSKITNDLKGVFSSLGQRKAPRDFNFNHLLVAQANMKTDFLAKIEREIQYAKKGKKAYICIKLNNLEEPEMIDKLYEASNAGVEIDLIVRGICCLRPGVLGLSENITIRRIVDQFLEHARVFIFNNGGRDEMYLASADWMNRNLNHRVEVGFPIYDESLKSEVKHIIDLQLQDNVKAVILDADLNNHFLEPGDKKPVRCQNEIYEWVRSKSAVNPVS